MTMLPIFTSFLNTIIVINNSLLDEVFVMSRILVIKVEVGL